MNVGANAKNIAILAVLLPAAGYLFYSNVLSGGGPPPASASFPAPAVKMPEKLKTIDLAQDSAMAVSGGGSRNVPPQTARTTARRGNSSQEWTPRVGGRRPEDRADPARTDPTLRLELLARLQNIPEVSPGRSLFDFTTAPVPKVIPPDETIVTKKVDPKAAAPEPTPAVPDAPKGPSSKPPPPAIPLKFYGFVQGQGGKRAFFRLGEEEIFMASEGQLVQGRYKIVRIGLSSATVEDTQHENNRQSLRIEEIPKEGD